MNAARSLPRAIAAAIIAVALAAPWRAAAQREGYTYLSFVGQDVSLVSRADDDQAARPNTPVLSGDSLVTGSGSRAEAVLADGAVVRVDGSSELRFEGMAGTYDADDDRDFLTLVRGTAAVEVRDPQAPESALRLDTDDATIVAAARCLFRVDAGRRGTEIYVLSGKVEVSGRAGRAVVRSGEYTYVSGESEIQVDTARAPTDRFAGFLDERRGIGAARDDTPYVSADFTYDYDAASLDDYGDWAYVPALGVSCWKPRVPLGWTPYALGNWRWTPAGLTWVSAEPWGWLPYHYGSWTFDTFAGWCWVPGAAYSPAWVYWNYTPGWVGWCPVGYYGYFDTYYRQSRLVVGGGSPAIYPHLRGRALISQIDPRGWNYVSAARLGARFDPAREIVRGDRMKFRPGETGMIATAPLRIERGASPAASIQEALRRIPSSEGSARPASVNEGLTTLLHRDRSMPPSVRETLGRTVVRAGQDPLYRTSLAEGAHRSERTASGDVWRERDRTAARGSQPESAPRKAGATPAARGTRRGDDGWRSSSSPPRAPAARRPEENRTRHEDSGWRAPQPRVIERERSHEGAAESRDTSPRAVSAPASQSAPAPAPAPAPAQPPVRKNGALGRNVGPLRHA